MLYARIYTVIVITTITLSWLVIWLLSLLSLLILILSFDCEKLPRIKLAMKIHTCEWTSVLQGCSRSRTSYHIPSKEYYITSYIIFISSLFLKRSSSLFTRGQSMRYSMESISVSRYSTFASACTSTSYKYSYLLL